MKGKRKGLGRYAGTMVVKVGSLRSAGKYIAGLDETRTLKVTDISVAGKHPDVRVRADVEYVAHGAWHHDVVKKLQRIARQQRVVLQDIDVEGRHFDIPEECTKPGCLACAKQLEMRAAGLPFPSEVRV